METDSSSIVHLEMTAAEILSEGRDLRLSRDLMERVLIDRLSGNFTTAAPPLPYLVGCYRRAYEEGKKIASMKDKVVRSEMESVVRQAKKLSVSYCRIHLGNPDMFPNWDSVDNSVASSATPANTSPLLPLIFSKVSTSVDGFGSSAGGMAAPPSPHSAR